MKELLCLLLIVLIWIYFVVSVRGLWAKRDKWIFGAVGIIMAPISVYMSWYFSYLLNVNTRIIGWPIMSAVFQRDSDDGPWLDYVGPITMIAPLLNYIVYVTFFVLCWLIYRKLRIRLTNQ